MERSSLSITTNGLATEYEKGWLHIISAKSFVQADETGN